MTVDAQDIPFRPVYDSKFDRMETRDTATEEFCLAPGRKYFIREPEDVGGDYYDATEGAMRRHIKSTYMPTTDELERMEAKEITPSQWIDNRLLRLEQRQRIDGAMILAGTPAGLTEQPGGNRFLSIQSPKLVAPREGPCDTILALLKCMFVSNLPDEEVDQLPYFIGWLQHALRSLYQGEPTTGLAVVLAGEVATGKTFLTTYILNEVIPGRAHPYASLVRGDKFDAEMASACLWLMDDRVPNTSKSSRRSSTNDIKAVTATLPYDYRGMHKQRVTLETFRRLVICTNLEASALAVLPQMDEDVADKISLFRIYDGLKTSPPMPLATEEEKAAFLRQVKSEIPSFVHHLLYEHQTPRELSGRFGVIHFHHPLILEHLFDSSDEAMILTMVDRVIFSDQDSVLDLPGGQWQGGAEALVEHLRDSDHLTRSEKNSLPCGVYAGRALSKLAKRHPARFISSREPKTGRHLWTIKPPTREGVKA